MSLQYSTQGFTWEPLDLVFSDGPLAALTAEIESWEGTPYMAGQQAKGAGVDCVRFVTSILDFLVGVKTDYSTLPADASLHARDACIAGMLSIKRRYPCDTVFHSERMNAKRVVQPGDVVVVGAPQGGPGHAMIVGPRPNTLWHSAHPNVHMTGLSFIVGEQKVYRVYRLHNRESWGVQPCS